MRWILAGLGLSAALVAVLGWWTVTDPPVTVEHPASVAEPRESSELIVRPAPLVQIQVPVSWEGVDLEAVRAALPDNRYWTEGAPTADPALQAERQRIAADRQRILGKVLSGNATDGEIAAYYDELQRINEDYALFAKTVLARSRGAMSERDVGLLELAQAMNEQRLAQLPDERLRAVVRKREQDRARAAWNDLQLQGGAP